MWNFIPKKTISAFLIFSFSFSFVFSVFQQKAYAEDEISEIDISGLLSGAAGLLTPDKIEDTTATAGWISGVTSANATPGIPTVDVGLRASTFVLLLSTLGINPATGSAIGAPPGTAKKQGWWDKIAVFVMRLVARQITMSIVNWINSGFQGNPSFVQDPAKFLTDTADRTIGEFIFQGPLNFLCDPFKLRVQFNLAFQYRPFRDKINCTLSDILNNINGAYDDFMTGNFINGGSWDTWLSISTQPQNSQIGAMLMAQSEMDAQIDAKKDINLKEVGWSGGLLSFKKCKEITTEEIMDADGKIVDQNITQGEAYYGSQYYKEATTTEVNNTESDTKVRTETKCTTETPGSAIQASLQQVTTYDLNQLGMADDINEIVNALANYAIKQILNKSFYQTSDENVDTSSNRYNWDDAISDSNSSVAGQSGGGGGTQTDPLAGTRANAVTRIGNIRTNLTNINTYAAIAKGILGTVKLKIYDNSNPNNPNTAIACNNGDTIKPERGLFRAQSLYNFITGNSMQNINSIDFYIGMLDTIITTNNNNDGILSSAADNISNTNTTPDLSSITTNINIAETINNNRTSTATIKNNLLTNLLGPIMNYSADPQDSTEVPCIIDSNLWIGL